MSDNHPERLENLRRLREQLAGTKIRAKIDTLESSEYIVNMNYQDLIEALGWVEAHKSAWSLDDVGEHEAFSHAIREENQKRNSVLSVTA